MDWLLLCSPFRVQSTWASHHPQLVQLAPADKQLQIAESLIHSSLQYEMVD